MMKTARRNLLSKEDYKLDGETGRKLAGNQNSSFWSTFLQTVLGSRVRNAAPFKQSIVNSLIKMQISHQCEQSCFSMCIPREICYISQRGIRLAPAIYSRAIANTWRKIRGKICIRNKL